MGIAEDPLSSGTSPSSWDSWTAHLRARLAKEWYFAKRCFDFPVSCLPVCLLREAKQTLYHSAWQKVAISFLAQQNILFSLRVAEWNVFYFVRQKRFSVSLLTVKNELPLLRVAENILLLLRKMIHVHYAFCFLPFTSGDLCWKSKGIMNSCLTLQGRNKHFHFKLGRLDQAPQNLQWWWRASERHPIST